MIAAARSVSDLPCCLGFGVRDAKSAEAAAKIADGVVVGSAVVKELEAGMESGDGPDRVLELVRKLRSGVDAARP
jgi:tryptophan synthase alpha chain